MKKLLIKIGLVILPLVAGLIGSLTTMPNIPTWYETLLKPSFNPPNYLFGPVWTILYILMGVALLLVFQSHESKSHKEFAYTVFGSQLVLNALWSIVFFGLHDLWTAFLIILILWVLIVINILTFQKISRPSAWLLVPYILWVTFASVLNFAVAWLN